jgi:Protein of unknown function (DUF3363)
LKVEKSVLPNAILGIGAVVGKVAAQGLNDKINDRHSIAVDCMHRRVHYAVIGRVRPQALPEKGMVVMVEASIQQLDDQLHNSEA